MTRGRDLFKPLSAILAIVVACIPFLSQAPAPKATFDVISIKPNASDRTIGITTSRDRFFAGSTTLTEIIQWAYRSPVAASSFYVGARIIGLPKWADTDHFDVEAKVLTDRTISQREMFPMVQALLEDRFQLRIHGEDREMAVYNLVVGKGGIKMTPSNQGQDAATPVTSPAPRRGVLRVMMYKPSEGIMKLSGTAISMASLVRWFELRLKRPVIDGTGLSGNFDISLEFPANETSISDLSSPAGVSIFTTIQDQLGLRLESTKASVAVLVIDSVQRPTEN